MHFRLADTFTASLAKLTGDEQKQVKTTVFDLQMDPANPGVQLHRLDKAKDSNFWSARVSRDLRIIVHRTGESFLLCYVGHHDDAYAWAERRKLEEHPKTGAMQIVEIREAVREVVVPVYVHEERPAPPVLAGCSSEDLLSYGVPLEWVDEALHADQNALLEIALHLPQEAQEALLRLAEGERPEKAPVAKQDPFGHPDAQRRFRLLESHAELEQALEYPWEQWTVFLHPSQRSLVDREFSGAARVSGSAGTGKTVVALHRAAQLAKRNPKEQVLLATFSEPLANALQVKLDRLVGNQPDVIRRVEVESLPGLALQLHRELLGEVRIVDASELRDRLDAALEESGAGFSPSFVRSEWREIVDAWQIEDWDQYRDVPRLGRKTRIGGKQRESLWSIFERVRAALAGDDLATPAQVLGRVTDALPGSAAQKRWRFAVVDESQDLGVPELRFLAALAGRRPEALFFAGDLGQRIFQPPFSWLKLGVDIRGRSHTLRVNYRTSHQIRRGADRLLPAELADVDGVSENRRGTVSVFGGPEPIVEAFASIEAEQAAVAGWLADQLQAGVAPDEIGLFVRGASELARAQAAAEAAEIPHRVLDASHSPRPDHLTIGTMHLAKGLEFRAVAVIACDDDIVPSQARIDTAAEPSDLEEIYRTERHLLYVACTRAREALWVSGVEPASEFLEDLGDE
ncbi:MAG: ATP-dependent helicase [Acidobacteria bacterium]|nr:MAG: ATP-dependent helicase [Acidobacteriota bacterium]